MTPSGSFYNTWDHQYIKDVELFTASRRVVVMLSLPRSPSSVRRLLDVVY